MCAPFPPATTYETTSNRMTTRLGVSVIHDAAGHVTADGAGRTFTYNQAGQLSQVKQGATLLATYSYNYKGQRSRKVTTVSAPQGVQTVIYHYDQQGVPFNITCNHALHLYIRTDIVIL